MKEDTSERSTTEGRHNDTLDEADVIRFARKAELVRLLLDIAGHMDPTNRPKEVMDLASKLMHDLDRDVTFSLRSAPRS
jgi:hypothetical protein